MSGRICSAGRTVFFEAQSLGVQEHPDGAPVALDAAPQKLRRQAPGRERPRPAALAQPRRRLSRQHPLLVTADLARRERARLALQLHPLRHAGRADPQRRRDRPRRLARLVPGHSPLAKILRVGSRHPCRPPPARIESRSSRFANPRFRQTGACSRTAPAAQRRRGQQTLNGNARKRANRVYQIEKALCDAILGFMTEGRPMSRTMSAFLRDEAGGAMILAAVILPIGLAAVGAAVTYSNVSATRVSYQKALDGAVLAGTILPGSASVAERIKAAEVVFAAGITGQVQSVTVASSTRFKVDTLGSDDVKVTGEASAEVKNLFGVIGGETIAIAVHSAGRKGQSEPVCLMALNGKEQGAVDLNGTVDVATNCPVQANSTDGAAVRQVGNAAMTSSMFAVAGN